MDKCSLATNHATGTRPSDQQSYGRVQETFLTDGTCAGTNERGTAGGADEGYDQDDAKQSSCMGKAPANIGRITIPGRGQETILDQEDQEDV